MFLGDNHFPQLYHGITSGNSSLALYRLLAFPSNFRRIGTLSANDLVFFIDNHELAFSPNVNSRCNARCTFRVYTIFAPCTNEKLEHDRVSPAVGNEDDGGHTCDVVSVFSSNVGGSANLSRAVEPARN